MSEKSDDPGKPKGDEVPGLQPSSPRAGETPAPAVPGSRPRNTPYPPTGRPRNTPYPPTSRPRNTPQSFPRVSTFSGPPPVTSGEKLSGLMKDPRLRQGLIGLSALVGLTLIFVGWTRFRPAPPDPDLTPGQPATPIPAKPPGERPTLSLPHPLVPSTAPETWRGLSLGMRLEEVPRDRTRPARPGIDWAQLLYQPDPEDPLCELGLSFHEGRLYRIVQDFSEDPYLPSSAILPLAASMYPKMQAYDYKRGKSGHLVTLFQSESRVFQMDFLRNEDGSALYRAELMDVEVARKAAG